MEITCSLSLKADYSYAIVNHDRGNVAHTITIIENILGVSTKCYMHESCYCY